MSCNECGAVDGHMDETGKEILVSRCESCGMDVCDDCYTMRDCCRGEELAA